MLSDLGILRNGEAAKSQHHIAITPCYRSLLQWAPIILVRHASGIPLKIGCILKTSLPVKSEIPSKD